MGEDHPNPEPIAESVAPQDMTKHCLDMADRCKQEARILTQQAQELLLRAGAWQQRAVQRQQREAALIDGSLCEHGRPLHLCPDGPHGTHSDGTDGRS